MRIFKMTLPDNPSPEFALPVGFRFSQSSLQDYVDCRRRFQLRYIQNLAWPALQSEPALENERFMLRGSLFHHLTQQFFSGVSAERLQAAITDPSLADWWDQFMTFVRHENLDQRISAQPPSLYAEKGFSAPLGVHRLVAQYDLILSDSPRKFLIYDWKTSRKRPKRKWLAGRIQTRLYPYLFTRAGASLNHTVLIEPQAVEMRYWFAAFPDQPERFNYSQAEYEQGAGYLTTLIDEIARLPADQFTLTPQIERCAFCVYRSLCNRGERAGSSENSLETDPDAESPNEIVLDFEQIAEIEY
jgi:CRISPR/Cas system-associated exonuclease Cas4 (RecB family)